LTVRDSGENDSPFATEEAAKIHAALRSARGPILCPRCGTPLSVLAAAGGGTVSFYWHYRCKPCRRGLTVGDVRG
jgi:hypothetical protein